MVIMKVRKINKSQELPSARYIGSPAGAVCPAVHSDPNIPVLCFPYWTLPIRLLIFLYLCMLYHKAHVPLLGFEATGNQLGVENSELQKMLRPAEPNCVN